MVLTAKLPPHPAPSVTETPGTSAAGLLPPADFRTRFGERGLIRLCLEVVERLALPPPRPAPGGGDDPPLAAMLSLLTYCYATGFFGSEEVEWAARNDPVAGYLCSQRFPDRAAIRQFRRSHRVLLERCLVEVCTGAWRMAFGIGGQAGVPDFPGEVDRQAAILAFARQRLNLAVLLDTAAWD